MDQYNKDRAVSTVPPPQKHETLLRMIQGLSVGLGSAGVALASHGKAGGVEMVTQIEGEQQRQRLEAQAARDARKNQALQQDLVNASNQVELMKMYQNLTSLPDELTLNHLRVSEAQQTVQKGQVDLQNAQQEFKEKYGFNPVGEQTPANQATNLAGALKITNGLINFAADPRVLGPDAQIIKDSQTKLADAQKSGDLDAVTGIQSDLRRALAYNQQAVESGIRRGQAAEVAPPTPIQTKSEVATVNGLTDLPDAVRKGYVAELQNAPTAAAQLAISNRAIAQNDSLLRSQAGRDATAANRLTTQITSLHSGIDNDNKLLSDPMTNDATKKIVLANRDRLQARLNALLGVPPSALPSTPTGAPVLTQPKPPNATHTGKGSDGHLYYLDAQGRNLGRAD
jgi:hypothetical protein